MTKGDYVYNHFGSVNEKGLYLKLKQVFIKCINFT